MPQKFKGKYYEMSHRPRRSREEPDQEPIRKLHSYDLERGFRPKVAFGPFYQESESEEWKEINDRAWEHVLRKSGGLEFETTEKYLTVMRDLENQARALYDSDDSITNLSSQEFTWMMMIDGCFLLQLALFVLGGSKQLDHPPNDPTFGNPGNEKKIKIAISSMFFVGNQIPIVVLKTLMKQGFFASVVDHGKWQQPVDLERRILFELLVLPMLGGMSSLTPLPNFLNICSFVWFPLKSYILEGNSQKPHDLLHGLWLLMTGSANKADNAFDDDDDDDDGLYDVVLPLVRSATELEEAGIFFKENGGTGISGIRFKKNFYNAVLMLPRIVIIDFDTTKLFWNLIDYEITRFGKKRVCAYFQLMRELIRSTDDAKLLATHGIIVADPKYEQRLPNFFQKLRIPKVSNDRHLRSVRNQISNYSQPRKWKNLRDILSVVLFLTLVQTVYTALGFHLKG